MLHCWVRPCVGVWGSKAVLAREWSIGETLANRRASLVNNHSTDRPMRVRRQAQRSPTIQSQGMGRGQEYQQGGPNGVDWSSVTKMDRPPGRGDHQPALQRMTLPLIQWWWTIWRGDAIPSLFLIHQLPCLFHVVLKPWTRLKFSFWKFFVTTMGQVPDGASIPALPGPSLRSDVLLPHRPKGNRASRPWTKTPETVTQNEPSLLCCPHPWEFCHNKKKLTQRRLRYNHIHRTWNRVSLDFSTSGHFLPKKFLHKPVYK